MRTTSFAKYFVGLALVLVSSIALPFYANGGTRAGNPQRMVADSNEVQVTFYYPRLVTANGNGTEPDNSDYTGIAVTNLSGVRATLTFTAYDTTGAAINGSDTTNPISLELDPGQQMAMVENELFGHERGAFTGAHRRKPGKFELADGGSIFLDEIGEMPLAVQAKLLHVLQDREFSRLGSREDVRVDVRVIAATNRDLIRLIDRGRFREDLYYRLSVVNISVPPLRDRREEIPPLIDYFLDRYARQYCRPRTALSPVTLNFFSTYTWPGNIRELENTIKRIVLVGNQDWLGEDSSDDERRESRALPPVTTPAVTDVAEAPESLDDAPSLTAIARAAALQAERGALKQVLDRVHWNRREAARLLKVSYRTLRRKIEQCGLED